MLREALEINPDFQLALLLLADSRHAWSGEFAEAVRLAERAIALDPDDDVRARRRRQPCISIWMIRRPPSMYCVEFEREPDADVELAEVSA